MAENLNASLFKAIDLLSPANPSEDGAWPPNEDAAADVYAATDERSLAAAAAEVAAAAAVAHAAALAAMQLKHQGDLAAASARHDAVLKVAAKTWRQEAALQDRRAGRASTGLAQGAPPGSPGSSGSDGGSGVAGDKAQADAQLAAQEAKLELAVRGREVAVLRAKRSEFLRALFHLGKRSGRELQLVALLRWKKQVKLPSFIVFFYCF